MKNYRKYLEPLAMIVLAALLFWAACAIDKDDMLDKIMVPVIYVCASLISLTGVYMFLPAGRKLFAKAEEIRREERAAAGAKMKTDSDILNLTLRKVVSRELPVFVALAVLFWVGKLTSLSILFSVWLALVVLDFVITYIFLKNINQKN